MSLSGALSGVVDTIARIEPNAIVDVAAGLIGVVQIARQIKGAGPTCTPGIRASNLQAAPAVLPHHHKGW